MAAVDENKLKSLPVFASLDRDQLRRVAGLADEVDVREGEELLHQGNFAHEFMVVEEGRARVERDGERVGELGPGDFLGEIAALDGGTRNATVTAESAMTLVVMNDYHLRQIARDMPALADELQRAAKERAPQLAD